MFNLMISVSFKMPYQEVREVSLRSGKVREDESREKSGHPVLHFSCHLQQLDFITVLHFLIQIRGSFCIWNLQYAIYTSTIWHLDIR